MRKVLLLCILVLLSITACQQAEQSSSPKTAGEEYESFAALVETAVANRDAESLDKLFDLESLIDATIAQREAPADYAEGFRKGLAKAYSPGKLIVGSMGQDSNYKLISTRRIEDAAVAIFRTVSMAGINYHEYILQEDEDGDIFITDYYSYVDAEFFSESITRLYNINLAKEIGDEEDELLSSIPDIELMAGLAEEAKFEQAFAVYNRLPEQIKQQKMLLSMCLNMGYEMGPAQLNRALATFRKYHPKDPLIHIKMLEFAIYDHDSTRVFAALDRLKRSVGDDPYLDIIRASVLRDSSRLEDSQKYLESAIEREKENDEAYWLLIDVLVKQEKYARVVEVYADMKKEFEVNPADYSRYDDYPGLFASNEYQAWIKQNPLDTLSVEPDAMNAALEALERQAGSPGGHGHDHHHH